jgi:hypothetical protein
LSQLLLLLVLLLLTKIQPDGSQTGPMLGQLGIGPGVGGKSHPSGGRSRVGGRDDDHPLVDAPPWWEERGRRPQQRGVLGGIAKTTKPLFLLRQIADFGLGCDIDKTQHRLRNNGKSFEFIEDSY